VVDSFWQSQRDLTSAQPHSAQVNAFLPPAQRERPKPKRRLGGHPFRCGAICGVWTPPQGARHIKSGMAAIRGEPCARTPAIVMGPALRNTPSPTGPTGTDHARRVAVVGPVGPLSARGPGPVGPGGCRDGHRFLSNSLGRRPFSGQRRTVVA